MWYVGGDDDELEGLAENEKDQFGFHIEPHEEKKDNTNHLITNTNPTNTTPTKSILSNIFKRRTPETSTTLYSDFLKSHKCYVLMPVSGKLVVLDTTLHVKAAFEALIENEVKSAPLWDSQKQEYVGMMTVTDFINVLRHFYRTPTGKPLIKEMEQHKISTWREITKVSRPSSIISTDPVDNLFDAAELLLKNHIHRLPIIDPTDNSILYIITHSKIINFLIKNIQQDSDLMDQSIKDLKIGTYEHVVTVFKDTPLITVLDLLAEKQISALPVVDEHGVIHCLYSNSDITEIARNRGFDSLDKPIADIVATTYRVNGGRDVKSVYTCSCTESLGVVIERLLATRVHRLILVDSTQRVVGVVSQSDLLKWLISQ
eukprot:TRINITY_DN3883_c0_g1_i1.p1 TRINITY_DN3883_c0_g1~~TRINITY_DN3883_c0_g1_i1.p1  ORF type:complete len:373 (-),score=47.76 TRINITY_DN3883_c0_g1_i1:1-1119(-)